VTSRVRAARAALVALHSQEEQLKAVSRWSGRSSVTTREQRARLKAERQEIQDEFGTLELDPLRLEGEQYASPTDVMKHFGAREGDARVWQGTYDYLCATANHPGLSATEYFEVVDGRPRATMANEFLRRFLTPCFTAWVRALEVWAVYSGWSREPVDEFLDRLHSVIPESVP